MVLLIAGSCNAAAITNSWAVQVGSGGEEAADELASKYGFANLGKVGDAQEFYHGILAYLLQIGVCITL